MANRIDGNGGDKDLQALQAYYEALRTKNAGKGEEVKEVKPTVEMVPKKVEANALDATAAQIWGVHLTQVDKSDAATTKRLEQAFINAPFMAELNELQGIEPADDFAAYALANIKGCDPDKLARALNKPLGDATATGVQEYMETLIS